MSFPRYPKYKDSGVEWLGEVPDHWEVKPLYSSVAERDEPNKGMVEDNLLSLSYGRIVQKDITSNDGLLPESFETYQVVRPGDIVFRLTDLQNDKRSLRSAIVEETGIITSAYLTVASRGPDSKYMSYLFRAYDVTKVFYSMGGGLRQSMKFADLKRMPILLPPPEEQTQIAAFLDRETAKIDTLVAEQRRLMELLKEKRQAVISHAVTQGLNPHAPMKPSGIEWLGDVPAHWEVLKGSLIGTLFGSEQVPEESVADEGDLPFIKVGSLSSDSFSIKSWDWFVDRAVAARYQPRSGFIVFPKRGAAIFNNKVNIVDRPSLIDPNLMGWAIGDRAITSFIAYALKSRKLNELADVSTVPQINNKHIAPERFPIPPIDEQRGIVAHLDSELATLDTLTAEAQRAIDLLQERRTALISAAVTGQIDVRPLCQLLKVGAGGTAIRSGESSAA